MRSPCWALCAVFLATCATTVRSQPATIDAAALFDPVVSYLGFSRHQQDVLLRGGAVHSGTDRLERRAQEVAVAGAMMLAERVPASRVIDQFLDTELFKQVHDLARYDPIALVDHAVPPEQLFADLRVGTAVHVRKMLAEPRAELNLGSEEVRRIARMTPRGPDTEAALAAELRRIMADRLAGYVERGFGGIGEYVRPSDRRASPADELGGAVAALAVFRPAFSEFIETLGSPVSREDEENGSRRLLWVETRFSGTPVWGLVDQARSQTTNAGIAAEIHFYATSAYNSMLTLVAALPYRERTLVVAINLVYTEQVTGLGSALKRRIARHMAATALAKHLERVRERLEP